MTGEKKGPGRRPKGPLDLDLKLNEKQRYWLEFLVDKGFRGNSVEEAAMRLLDQMFEKLYEEKVLPDAFIEPVQSAPAPQDFRNNPDGSPSINS